MIPDQSGAVILARFISRQTALPTILCQSKSSASFMLLSWLTDQPFSVSPQAPACTLHRTCQSFHLRRGGRVLWTAVRPSQQQEATLSKRGWRVQSQRQAAEPPSTVRDRKLEEELWEQLQPGSRKAAEVRKSQQP